MPKMSLNEAFHEVYSDVPSSVRKSKKTGKERTDMMKAIALSKAGKKKDCKMKMSKHDEECLRRGYSKC